MYTHNEGNRARHRQTYPDGRISEGPASRGVVLLLKGEHFLTPDGRACLQVKSAPSALDMFKSASRSASMHDGVCKI